MHALIFEPDHHGHRFAYAGPMLSAIGPLADRVTLVTTEAARGSAEFKGHIEPRLDRAEVDYLAPIDSSSPWKAARGKVRLFHEALTRHRPDHVYVPTGDGLSQLLGARPLPSARKGTECEVCLHRGGWAYPSTTLKRRLAMRAGLAAVSRAPFAIVHHVDVVSYEWIRARGGDLARRSRLLADPVESAPPLPAPDARRTLGIPEDGRYLGCAGALDERKGIDLLVNAFAAAPLEPSDRLLLAGRLSAGVRALIAQRHGALLRSGRIVLIDRFVSAAELHASLCAMDLVVTPYPAHVGLSNIALRAAVARRPILASDFGWLGIIVPRFGLGVTTSVRDEPGFARAMRDRLDASSEYRYPAGADRLLAFHSHTNFGACWTARLRERLGKPASADLRTWDWVNEGLPSGSRA